MQFNSGGRDFAGERRVAGRKHICIPYVCVCCWSILDEVEVLNLCRAYAVAEVCFSYMAGYICTAV